MTTTEERLRRAMVTMAHIVRRHGPQYAVLMERMERDHREAQTNEPMARADALLRLHASEAELAPRLERRPQNVQQSVQQDTAD